MAQETMSVWQSLSGNLHWLRGCTGAGGRHRVRRVSVTREQLEQARRCRCMRHVAFEAGRRAKS
jgi:hypothetical protein